VRILIALVFAAALTVAPSPVTVPFVWRPGQIEVHVTVNGAPATFVLDTGSEYSVVSTRLATSLSLHTEHRGARDFADAVTLGVGPLTLADERVMVMPFDTFHARGREIDGLLGFDLFERCAVKIDWRAKRLTLWARGGFAPPPTAVPVPIAFSGRLPVIAATIQIGPARRLPVRLMVDTGASQSVMLRHPFADANALFALAAGERSAPSLADGTRRLVAIPVEGLAVGALTFDHPEVLAFTEPIGSAASTDTDGLIGNTLLSRYTLYVDYAGKRLYFEPLAR
jgi:hypothetical protein